MNRPTQPLRIPDDLVMRARDTLAWSSDVHERQYAQSILDRAQRQANEDRFARFVKTANADPEALLGAQPAPNSRRRGRLFFGLLG